MDPNKQEDNQGKKKKNKSIREEADPSGNGSAEENKQKSEGKSKSKGLFSSTTSLGKRRRRKKSPKGGNKESPIREQGNPQRDSKEPLYPARTSPSSDGQSTMSNPRTSEYGSQATSLRIPIGSKELVKVTILGAAGGIGQPLSLLLMLHDEYIQHLALYDLVHVRGVGADLSHVDRQCKVTTHLGPDELIEAVQGAKVIVIPAGLAQKPGMSRDDLFGSNAKIIYNLAKVCAQYAPEAHLALISNPVNSLLPLTCEVYQRVLNEGGSSQKSQGANQSQQQQQQQQASGAGSNYKQNQQASASQHQSQSSTKSEGKHAFNECFRRIFGVTTLDVVRASTLTAKSALFKSEPNGLFKDPSKISVPVVGGHAGKTIIPLLSQANPKLDKKKLLDDKSTVYALIDSIQQAGIEVLNAKKGAGSATLAMAYAACRFTISLLRAQQGEQNIIECAYVRHQSPITGDLDYFSTQLVLGKDGYVKSLPLGNLLPFEKQMIEEGSRELRTSIARGEDFAREHLSSEKV